MSGINLAHTKLNAIIQTSTTFVSLIDSNPFPVYDTADGNYGISLSGMIQLSAAEQVYVTFEVGTDTKTVSLVGNFNISNFSGFKVGP